MFDNSFRSYVLSIRIKLASECSSTEEENDFRKSFNEVLPASGVFVNNFKILLVSTDALFRESGKKLYDSVHQPSYDGDQSDALRDRFEGKKLEHNRKHNCQLSD